MENETFLEKVATPLQSRASVNNVFGEPITAQGKTIVPVATIAFGFGGGFGRGNQSAASGDPASREGEGGGGGGGMYARPKGVYEITPTGTRYIPVNRTKDLMLAALAGFLIRSLLGRKK